MPQSAIPVYRFPMPATLPLEASFDGGRLTSDGGLPWLEQADAALGLCAAFMYGLANRSTMIADILRDRNALYRETADAIENGYTLKIANKTDLPQDYVVSLQAPGTALALRASKPVHVAAGDVMEAPLLVEGPKSMRGRRAIVFTIRSADGQSRSDVKSSFFGPME